MDVCNEPISSLCFNSGNENIIYVSAGNELFYLNVTGGLDSKLITWDFSKGRPRKIVDFGLPDMRSGSNAGQCLNPAFVHTIKVPDVDMLDKLGKICVVSRGDGVIDIIDMESELTAMKPKSSMKSRKGTQSVSKGSDGGDPSENGTKWLHLDYSLGGHTAAIGDNNALLHFNINLSKKVNWLCTTPVASDNIVICDTTKASPIDQDRLCSTSANLD
ncbi:Transducin/WD40 repeat-like superfamily protein isoform 2 [Hibiscus syriacus]|uniref:Transducin/WD40 repeat-like superfamily protein isoform 2 n=1 Tax=Hibiscus syriacus TaxID=106335 RepID=A0A6A2ZXC3_HIBSY|nr:Transducin/WD40 repeat-like superfamily protein isoform 2 [Hibiscus syriacus]